MLLVLEGIDGSGKSTQIEKLRKYLMAKGKRVEVSREPTDGYWGRKFVQSITEGRRMTREEEVEYLLLDREEHVSHFRPLLDIGIWVLLDRYYPSMVAYQGANGGNVEELVKRNRAIAPDPDLCLWLDLPPDKAVARIRERGKGVTKLETEAFLTKVREVYASFNFPWFKRVDADGREEDVADRVALEFGRWVRYNTCDGT